MHKKTEDDGNHGIAFVRRAIQAQKRNAAAVVIELVRAEGLQRCCGVGLRMRIGIVVATAMFLAFDVEDGNCCCPTLRKGPMLSNWKFLRVETSSKMLAGSLPNAAKPICEVSRHPAAWKVNSTSI